MQRCHYALSLLIALTACTDRTAVDDKNPDRDTDTEANVSGSTTADPVSEILDCTALCDVLEGCGLTDPGCSRRTCATDGSGRPEGIVGESQICLGNVAPDCEAAVGCVTMTARFDNDLDPTCHGCALNETASEEREYLDPTCAAARANCHDNADCRSLLACRNYCTGDVACEQWCDGAHDEGTERFAAMMSCAVCIACDDACAPTPLSAWCD
jgi:hypothetical protein